jgi:hypothetical protein
MVRAFEQGVAPLEPEGPHSTGDAPEFEGCSSRDVHSTGDAQLEGERSPAAKWSPAKGSASIGTQGSPKVKARTLRRSFTEGPSSRSKHLSTWASSSSLTARDSSGHGRRAQSEAGGQVASKSRTSSSSTHNPLARWVSAKVKTAHKVT